MAEPMPAVRTDAAIDPLLTTKLRVPSTPPQHVHRARLIALLQQALARPLTLIAAPAGFGKTTLLAAWLHAAAVPAASDRRQRRKPADYGESDEPGETRFLGPPAQ